MPCDSSFLANITMFEHLDEDDRIALANVVDELKVPEGHTLFQAGDPGDSLFIVRVGQIELFIKDTAGQKIVLTTVGTWRHVWRTGHARFRIAHGHSAGAY
jgi:CRP-like cAMP-binding protein